MTGFDGGVSRRNFLATASALGLMGVAGRAFAAQDYGISPPPKTLPAANGPLQWLDSGDQKAVFFKAFLAQYGKDRGIKTVYNGLPWTEIATLVPLGIRNGTAPDAFALPYNMPPSVAIAQGWVQPLDDLIPEMDKWKAGFPKGSFIEGVNMAGGKTYGLPFTSDRRSQSLLLFGKKAMALTEFSPTPDKTLTWDEFRKAAAQITKKSNGQTPGWIMGGAQVVRWALNVLTLAQRAGAACGNAGFMAGLDYRTGDYVLDSPEFIGAVELLLAIRDDGSAFPGLLSLNAPQARAFVAQGNAGIILQGPWCVPVWEAQNPDFDFGYANPPAPAGKDGKVLTDSLPASTNMMFVNAHAKNPAYAADVFRIMGTLAGQTAWADVVGCSDPAIFPEANRKATMSDRSRGVIEMQEKLVRATPVPFSHNTAFVDVARLFKEPTPNLAQTVQGLYAGQLTDVKASMKTLNDAMNKALDAAIKAANGEGKTVKRADLVFKDWDPTKDYF